MAKYQKLTGKHPKGQTINFYYFPNSKKIQYDKNKFKIKDIPNKMNWAERYALAGNENLSKYPELFEILCMDNKHYVVDILLNKHTDELRENYKYIVVYLSAEGYSNAQDLLPSVAKIINKEEIEDSYDLIKDNKKNIKRNEVRKTFEYLIDNIADTKLKKLVIMFKNIILRSNL